MPLQVITPPTSEPITVDEAKAHLRVDHNLDDALITAMISACRDFAEAKTRRSFLPQTLELTLDSFPGPSLMGVPYGKAYSIPGHAIILERPPIASITSIKYLDTGGTLQTMPTTDYVDLTAGGTQRIDDLCRITPVFGKIWPINLWQIGSVKVRYVAGWPDVATIPPALKAWMKLRLGALYENREEVAVGTRIVVAELPFVDGILDQFTVEVF